MISDVLNRIIRWIPALLSAIIALVSVFPASLERLDEDAASQVSRIAALEQAYANGEIAPVEESAFFDGDLAAELEAGIKFNELSFLGTHNSYQTSAIEETKKLSEFISRMRLSLRVKP